MTPTAPQPPPLEVIGGAGGRKSGEPRVLVIRLSSLGDVVLTTVFLRALRRRYPDAAVDFLTKELYAPLMAAQPTVDRALAFRSGSGLRGLLATGRYLRSRRYDIVFDLHKNLRSRPLAALSGAGLVFSPDKLSLRRRLLIWLGLDLFAGKPDIPGGYVASGSSLGLLDDGGPPELVPPPAPDPPRIDGERPWWGLVPMASSSNKRWPGYGELGRSLLKRYGGTCLVFGGPGEEAEGERIAAATGRGVNLAGRLDLSRMAGLLAECAVVFANDTGPMHVAVSLGTPTVAFFGPTTKQLGYFPRGAHVRTLERSMRCRPCTRNGLDCCPKRLEVACLSELSPAEALAAAEELGVFTAPGQLPPA